jgi:hypothetical protein
MPTGQSDERTDELNIDEPRDAVFMRREWAIERISWVVMLAIVAATLAGLLGTPGFASTTHATTADGALSLEYGRIERHHAPTELIFEVAPGAVLNGEIRLWISRDYTDTLSVQTVFPEPESVEVESDRIVYVFAAGEAADGPLTITIKHEHDGYWQQHGELGLVDGASLTFTQFILP